MPLHKNPFLVYNLNNGILIFLVVAIVVDTPRWMSRNPFKAGLFKLLNICYIYRADTKQKYIFFLIYRIFVMRMTYKA